MATCGEVLVDLLGLYGIDTVFGIPGVHTVELRDPSGRSFYQERIEVIRGKTLEIHPDFRG